MAIIKKLCYIASTENLIIEDSMFGLIPKEEKFFQMFRDMMKNIVLGAHALKEMLDNYTDPTASQLKIKEIEHKGDLQTHEIIRTLNKSFITPFEREDIYALASALDDIIDSIDVLAQHIIIYHIDKITPEAKELGFIILKACQVVEKAVATLDGKTRNIGEYCVEINSLEGEADRVRADAISRLFDEEKDPIFLIKWKEIYENLEHVTDRCEDAANILESVVVKNA
jgi:predicted phosphate transport protein (TIGR00153 family)